ncbi:MAG: hypothetical protein K9L70_10020 [Thiohalocapsa sp.]|nr:hypothetical protein [Thiohalocapsa sp.]
MNLLWLLLAFTLFMAAIWSVYALNRTAARRFGYEPFSLPNAALMLVANLLLLSSLSGLRALEPDADLSATLPNIVQLLGAALLSAVTAFVIARRTRLWMALYAVSLMAVGAIALFPSLVFRYFAFATGDDAGDLPPRH